MCANRWRGRRAEACEADFATPAIVFQTGVPLGRIDILTNWLPYGDLAIRPAIQRPVVEKSWPHYEREFVFDAALLNPGQNILTLTIPGGNVTAGVVYDYLRLELDEG